ncbi:MAG: hypothetical protein J2O48_09195, partial [Solirubrobacterales bacterium]|nr:hypothetical protein [Solirubrobacterales bacterium]
MAPLVAGALVLVFGTAGSISVILGWVLMGLTPIIWLWDWFVRISFDADDRDKEAAARERRCREQRLALERRRRGPPH